VLDLRDVAAEIVLDDQLLARRDVDRGAVDLGLDAETAEGGQDRAQVAWLRVVDGPVARRHRRETDEARDLDVVRADPPLAAGERGDPVDADDVRLVPLEPRFRQAE